MRAIEFFSGIGAFAEATRDFDVQVVAAFDQNAAANTVYAHNFNLQPLPRNLDTIKLAEVPRAQLWWISPPCTPFSIRGRQRDLSDSRSLSFINLVDLACLAAPEYLLLENVSGFKGSQAENYLKKQLRSHGYHLNEHDICSTDFGVPMKRPRHFVVASQNASPPTAPTLPQPVQRMEVRDFLFEDDRDLFLPPEVMARYQQGFDLVDPEQLSTELTCFTRNYERCMRASGSLISTLKGARRLSPEEILKLLGFSSRFQFPDQISRRLRWRLVGNSVDIRAIKFLLETINVGSAAAV